MSALRPGPGVAESTSERSQPARGALIERLLECSSD